MSAAIFTPDQVQSINCYQAAGIVHPFTCSTNGCEVRVLTATENGFICKGCDYTQDWCHRFMANWEWAASVDMPIHGAKIRKVLEDAGLTVESLRERLEALK